MNATTQLRLTAPLDLQNCGNGLWFVRPRDAQGPRIYLRGLEPPAELAGCTAVTVEWLAGGQGQLILECPTGTLTVPAPGIFAHGSPAGLYSTLPLARFDARMLRFWRRVFLLVRLPGARWVLRRIAEKSA